jgi:hypothetical protein
MTLHTCPPPNLSEWLEEYSSDVGNYGHLLLEQKKDNDADLLLKLKPYFKSAHLDARTNFHEFMGIDLHPDAATEPVDISYPSSLHLTTLKGFFGEALTGLIVEGYELVGKHSWKIPVFLFRFHDDAKKYLFTLVRDPEQRRKTIGRLGTDFVGISIDENGEVERLISGEAKWRKTLTQGVVDDLMLGPKLKGQNLRQEGKGIWAELNKEVNPPNGLRELQIALKEIDPDGYAESILSMDKLLSAYGANVAAKTDLVVIVGNGSVTRENGNCFVVHEEVPKAYSAGNDLQVVEIVLNDGEQLIKDLYSNLWNGED